MGSGLVRSSHQTVSDYTIGHNVNDFQTLNNPGSWQPVGPMREISFTFHFWHKSFIFDDVKLAELSDNSFEWKNVTKHSLTPPTYSPDGKTPETPRIYDLIICQLRASFLGYE